MLELVRGSPNIVWCLVAYRTPVNFQDLEDTPQFTDEEFEEFQKTYDDRKVSVAFDIYEDNFTMSIIVPRRYTNVFE